MLLAALTIFTLSACSASEEEEEKDLGQYEEDEDKVVDHITTDGHTFYFDAEDSDTITITAYEGSDALHDLISPEKLNEKTVVGISERAFYFCSNIKSVTIPATVKSIGDYAFAGCSMLLSLDIPAKVKTIGEGAFYGCTSLETFRFAEESELSAIERYTFYECTSLASVTIPAYIDTIGTAAFFACESLESVTVEEGTLVIGAQAFQNCTALASLKLPASVASIGELAFYGSDNLYRNAVECPEGSYADGVIDGMNLTASAPADPGEDTPVA